MRNLKLFLLAVFVGAAFISCEKNTRLVKPFLIIEKSMSGNANIAFYILQDSLGNRQGFSDDVKVYKIGDKIK